MESRNIDLPVAVALRLQSRSGRVHVIAEPRDDVAAETDRVESFLDDGGRTLVVRSSRGGSKPLTVRCPVDTDIVVGTHTGHVRLEGKFGGVYVTTMSGSIEVDDAEEADLRSMSGGLSIGTCRGRCRMNAVSGTVAGGEMDSALATTVSGSIKLRRVHGEVRAKSISGSIEMSASGDSNIAVKTVSGKVRIGLPEGTEPRTSFKTRGAVHCEFAAGDDCRIDAASLSGSHSVSTGAANISRTRRARPSTCAGLMLDTTTPSTPQTRASAAVRIGTPRYRMPAKASRSSATATTSRPASRQARKVE